MTTLVTLNEPHSPAAEAYHGLRTNLEFAQLDTPLRSVLITTPDGSADNSLALANLAVTMAQTGDRVVVVDGDLRRPQQHEIFGLSNQSGLSTWLTSGEAIAPQATQVEGLRVLTAGPAAGNPIALLSNKRLTQVLTLLAEDADYILCDAPPVLAVTDAALWASKVDGVLMVVNAGSTKRDHAQRAKAVLEKVRARLIGAVLINVDKDAAMSGWVQG